MATTQQRLRVLVGGVGVLLGLAHCGDERVETDGVEVLGTPLTVVTSPAGARDGDAADLVRVGGNDMDVLVRSAAARARIVWEVLEASYLGSDVAPGLRRGDRGESMGPEALLHVTATRPSLFVRVRFRPLWIDAAGRRAEGPPVDTPRYCLRD